MKIYRLASVLMVILLAACSSKEVYQFGQNYQKNDCINKAATEADHRACEALDPQSYEEYEKERKKLKKGKS